MQSDSEETISPTVPAEGSLEPAVEGVLRALPAGGWRDGLLAVLVVAAAVALTLPFAPMFCGDDVSFSRTARIFAQTGHVVYNGWASMPLGWLLVWAAVFIKLFGFSPAVLYASNTVLGLMCVFLLHDIFLRFGLNRRNAVLATLTVGLSPLFLVLMGTFLSDLAGLIAILLCISMCQRAVVARSAGATAAWLVAAGVVNLFDGTVRQICWMGVLVMVPATGWMLRRRRGVFPAAVVTAVVGAMVIALMLRWFNSQPYVVPEHLMEEPLRPKLVLHFFMQWTGAILLTTVILAPILLAWLRAAKLKRAAVWRTCVVMAVSALGLLVIAHHTHKPDSLAKALLPWLEPIYEVQGFPRPANFMSDVATFSIGIRGVLSVLVIGITWALGEFMLGLLRSRFQGWSHDGLGLGGRGAFWILVPYSVAYMAALSGRATFAGLQDRYLLLLLPGFLVGLVLLYQRYAGTVLPGLTALTIGFLGVYAVLGARNANAYERALHALDLRMQAEGVPRSELGEGLLVDMPLQFDRDGYVNRRGILRPADAYRSLVPTWGMPMSCETYDQLLPDVHPVYFLTRNLDTQCLAPSRFAPLEYRGWLPPFHRQLYVMQKKDGPPAQP